jgi:hypothetical protein
MDEFGHERPLPAIEFGATERQVRIFQETFGDTS